MFTPHILSMQGKKVISKHRSLCACLPNLVVLTPHVVSVEVLPPTPNNGITEHVGVLNEVSEQQCVTPEWQVIFTERLPYLPTL
jgi:hypothetical protein